ncbi:hypothetical protein MHB44_11865 [Lysinibacillus sp. FSL H8-0500]|uniref:hypothetical protein n=1 Tax=Lysinibacillus sp. FSL H8-0500 TaxID=2921393 RepID=UPI0031014972
MELITLGKEMSEVPIELITLGKEMSEVPIELITLAKKLSEVHAELITPAKEMSEVPIELITLAKKLSEVHAELITSTQNGANCYRIHQNYQEQKGSHFPLRYELFYNRSNRKGWKVVKSACGDLYCHV